MEARSESRSIRNRPIRGPATLLVSLVVLLGASVLFFAGYIYVAYEAYHQSFENLQRTEIKNFLVQESKVLNGLQHIKDLTAHRIETSKHNVQKIQNILSSTSQLLPPLKLPDIRKVIYTKLSNPQKTFCRFGVLSPTRPIENPTKIDQISCTKDSLTLEKIVLNTGGTLEGHLEIEVSAVSFAQTLGTYNTIAPSPHFSQTVDGIFLGINKQRPSSLWDFLQKNWTIYNIYLWYILTVAVFMAVSFTYVKDSLYRKYNSHISELKEDLERQSEELENLSANLSQSYHENKVQKTSSQAQKALWLDMSDNQRQNAAYLYRLLYGLRQSLSQDPMYQKQTDILSTCIPLTEYFLMNSLPKLQKQEIPIGELLEIAQDIFADKISQNHIIFEIRNPANGVIYGRLFSLKMIFLNVVGKCIHRVPQNGRIMVEIQPLPKGVLVTLQDNGFFLSPKQEELIEKKHFFFIDPHTMKKLLSENGVQCLKDPKLNKIVLKITSDFCLGREETNVVPLFQ